MAVVDLSPSLARIVDAFVRLDHPSPDHGPGRRWLDAELALLTQAEAMDLLIAAIAAMPKLRAARSQADERGVDGPLWKAGAVAHAAATVLFARGHEALEPGRDEIVNILSTAAHDCGHGSDLPGALELAIAELRRNGADADVLAGVATWREGLRGLRSTKAQVAARKADYILLADPATDVGNCWSEEFRTHIFSLESTRTLLWQQLIFSALPTDHLPPPKRFTPVASQVIADVGIDHILDTMRRTLPCLGATGVRTTGPGSHLMKHLVWLLHFADPDRAPELAMRIATIKWATKRETALGQKANDAAEHCLSVFAATVTRQHGSIPIR